MKTVDDPDDREQTLVVWFYESNGYSWSLLESVRAQNMGVGLDTTWFTLPNEEPSSDVFTYDESFEMWRIDNDDYDHIRITDYR